MLSDVISYYSLSFQYYARARLLALHRINPEKFEMPCLTDEVVSLCNRELAALSTSLI